jgi:hypothetical protein
MKHRTLFLLLLIIMVVVSIITSGCEKDGKIRIVNRTTHNLYASVLDRNYAIPTAAKQVIEVSTKIQTPLTGDVGKWVLVTLQGETYQIWDNYLNRYVDSTYVWVNAGKTISIYTFPNQASVKIKNQSGLHIKRVLIERNTNIITIPKTYEVDLSSGVEWYKQVPYASNEDPFFLTVTVTFDDNSTINYGNLQRIYGLDEQFLIEVQPPKK